jgi:mono/diheme cytochrome c family protein
LATVFACFSSLGPAIGEELRNSFCLDCHSDKTLSKTNASGKDVSLFVDVAKLAASIHKTNTCASCHSDLTAKHPDDNIAAQTVNCAKCHATQSESYGASVHGIAAAKGQKDSATCSDCHDGHTVVPPSSPESPLHYSRLAQTCGGCHEQAAQDIAESVHGKALAAGKRDAPTCTDCHSEHKIVGLKGISSLKIAAEVCSNCHASERMNTKYNLPPDRVKTFFESYHGLAAQYGSTLAANCGSCHGDAAHSGGLVPDLRHSKALTDDDLWRAVVINGALAGDGMVAFGADLGEERLGAVRAYLIARAQESYAADKAKAAPAP